MQSTFAAMGTTIRVGVVVVPRSDVAVQALLCRARRLIIDLESQWSRFVPESEVCRLGDADGQPLAVSATTRLLVRRMVEASHLTGGCFDPTVAPAMRAIGYTVTFDELLNAGPPHREPPRIAPGCEGIEVDDVVGTVRLPRGVELDPGGIGKGLAADLVVADLLGAGASGACVEIGGDVRVRGEGPEGRGWVIQLTHPQQMAVELGRAWLADGAVATSSVLRRRWDTDDGAVHHLIDPRTGAPTSRTLGAVVIAGSAWLADVLATAAIVGASGESFTSSGAAALVFSPPDAPVRFGAFDDYLI